MVLRRAFLAGASAVIASVVGSGCTLFNDDGDGGGESTGAEETEQNTSDEKAAESTRNESGNETEGNTSDEQNATETGTQNESNESNENETEYPEASNPEPEPEGSETNESVINESRAGSEPSAEDVVIENAEMVTESRAATVTGVVRNTADVPVTVELRVTFFDADGKQIGRPALNGTTGLPPGATFDTVEEITESTDPYPHVESETGAGDDWTTINAPFVPALEFDDVEMGDAPDPAMYDVIRVPSSSDDGGLEVREATGAVPLADLFDEPPIDADRDDQEERDDGRISLR